MPGPRVLRELARTELVNRLIRALGVAPNAAQLADQAVSAWVSEFSEGAELPQTEAVIVLLFALTRAALPLGAELRDALRQTQRADLVRLKRFASSLSHRNARWTRSHG